MERTSAWPVLSLTLLICLAPAQTLALDVPAITIASSPSPVGSGARAAGFGGAFIAIADDATAASWNPGGLYQLERPEISAVGGYFLRAEDFSDSARAEGDLYNSTQSASLNYLSVAYPFSLMKRNMVASLNYQQMLDFNRDLHLHLSQNQLPLLLLEQELDFEQRGSLNAISPALCVQIVPRVSVGLAVNFWMDDIFRGRAWEAQTRSVGWGEERNPSDDTSTPFTSHFRRDEEFSGFFGVNVTVGVLWQVWRGLQLGAVVKTPFTAHADRTYSQSLTVEGYPDQTIPPTTEEVEIRYPWTFGFGLAYRFSDRWTASVDLTRVEWGDFTIVQTDPDTGLKVETSPFTGTPSDEADVGATHTVRAGAEYLIVLARYVIPIRGGVFYDPLPSKGGVDDYFGFSLGSGLMWKSLSFDLAYTLRFGQNVMGDLLTRVPGTQADVTTHQFLFSTIYYF